jgi:HSP20 family protein
MLSPFRGFRDMQSEMERMMGEVFGRYPRTAERTEWTPAIDVTIEDENLVIHAELPGMKREDVDVSLSGGVLTLDPESGSPTTPWSRRP